MIKEGQYVANVMTFCLPANVFIVPMCMITEAFLCKDVCLIFTLGRVSGNTVPGAIFPNTLPAELEIIYFDISSLLPVNTKKYIRCGEY